MLDSSSKHEDPAADRAQPWKFTWVEAAHIACLSAFAVAQPLYDILGQHPTFFVASQAQAVDLIALIAILSLLVPAGLALVPLLVSLVHRPAGRITHWTVLGLLGALVVAPLVGRTQLPDPVVIAGALVAGIALVIAYARSAGVRSFATLLSLSALVFPVRFVIRGDIANLIFPSAEASAGPAVAHAARPVPVVMVLLDELSLLSLLDGDGELDVERYPGIGRLARQAHWYRNATAVADATIEAVPAVLTGTFPSGGRPVAVSSVYPENLFTLLAPSHRINAEEIITRLCPPTICPLDPVPFRERMTAILRDTGLVFMHWTTPPGLKKRLPPISDQWAGFGSGDKKAALAAKSKKLLDKAVKTLHADRSAIFRRFVASVTRTERPALNFLHILIPHVPHHYLPSGRKYADATFRGIQVKREELTDDPAALDAAHRRYLLQLQHVDHLLAELWKHLEDQGLFDDALIVFLSDHGLSFEPGGNRRILMESNHLEVMPVPLLIKLPGQKEAVVSDVNAQLIDVLPTIAGVLGIDLPWPVDGVSLLKPREARPVKRARQRTHDKVFEFPHPLGIEEIVRARTARFGQGADLRPLFAVAGAADLIWTPVDQWEVTSSTATVELENPHRYENVRLDETFVPVDISGQLNGVGVSDTQLAVAVNGKIGAVADIFDGGQQKHRFAALVSDKLLVPGRNRIDLFLVQWEGEQLRLARVPNLVDSIQFDPGSNSIATADARLEVRKGAIRSNLEFIKPTRNGVSLTGWAVNLDQKAPADRILIFAGSSLAASGSVLQSRQDVASHFKVPELARSGFQVTVPYPEWLRAEKEGLALFAVSGNSASPLQMEAVARCQLDRAAHLTPDRVELFAAGEVSEDELAEVCSAHGQ